MVYLWRGVDNGREKQMRKYFNDAIHHDFDNFYYSQMKHLLCGLLR